MNVQQSQLDGYVLAASVMDTFEPERLEPVEGFRGDLGTLLDLAVMSEKTDGTIEWRLPNDVRRSALQTLAKQDRLAQALAASKDAAAGDRVYQDMFEQYLESRAIPIESQTLEQLQASLNAVKLLEGVVPQLPDPGEIRAALVRQDYIAQFEHLAGRTFVGRKDELAELRHFVDVLPESFLDTARRAGKGLLAHLGIHRILYEAPLVITGMGGIGKSALLSKFVLEHLTASASRPDFLFAYIDFDKPGIWPDQPLTVLAEIVRQLSLQVPAHADDFQQLHAQILEDLPHTALGSDYASSEGFTSRGTQGQRRWMWALKMFVDTFNSALAGTTGKTLLLVFDTFEEVSQRSTQHQEQLFIFVGELQRILPRLRVVISGRGIHADAAADGNPDAPPHEATGFTGELAVATTPLELKPLSKPEATALLQSMGSLSSRLNAAIYRRVGGHPLSLKLAAQLVCTVAKSLGKPASDLRAADLFGDKWIAHMSEGMVYRRIIAHIPDEGLKKLTDPGFVLRELTADIVFAVLNEPCELGLPTSDDARNLFDRLKQFNQLVTIQSDAVVRYRPDLRERVLNEVMRGNRTLCHEIWFRASRYYQDRSENRTEELYCRLMLDEEPRVLADRWQSGLEKNLLRSRKEMPVRARQFLDLMTLTGDSHGPAGELVSGDLDLAVLTEEMKLLLSRGNAKEALDLYRATATGRVPRHDSVLHAVHVRAIAQSGEVNAALKMALEGMLKLEEEGRTHLVAYEDLLLLTCQVRRAQRSPKTKTFFSWLQQIFGAPLPASKLVERFNRIDFDAGRPVSVLRIAIALLELLYVERSTRNKAEPGALDQEVAHRGWDALVPLSPDFADVDGGLLTRSLAWLGPHFNGNSLLHTILATSQVRSVLARDYAEAIEVNLRAERRPKLKWLRGEGRHPQLIAMSADEMRDFCIILRAVILAADEA